MNDFTQDIKLIKSKIKIYPTAGSSYIIAVVFDNNFKDNVLKGIPCLKGMYDSVAYDFVKDQIVLECVDFFHIGKIPVRFKAKIPGVFGWSSFIPFNETIILKYMTSEQKNDYSAWKSLFKGKKNYSINYIHLKDSMP